ncbi:MAG: hypothetical protein PHF26_01735 [Candidatus Gracilibacteria bacterium]|nr:hypothetical protein [Candidatus Gracilibacteria bacterium]
MLEITYSSHINQKIQTESREKLEKENEELNRVYDEGGYDDVRSSLNLPFDESILKNCSELCKKVDDASVIVVVGIGGPGLAAKSIYQATNGVLANEDSLNDKNIYYADTTDSLYIDQIKRILKKHIENGKKVLINIISKSGKTTETLANFSVLVDFLEENQPDWRNYVVVTTGRQSELWKNGEENGFHLLSLPEPVGGRYSAFSSVGIFPLKFMGVNCERLLEGARDAVLNGLQEDIFKNHSMSTANVIYNGRKKIFDLAIFSNQFDDIGKWYKQLMGESLSKEFSKDGTRRVNAGINPDYNIGSTLLHSITQTYLSSIGSRDRIIGILNIKSNNGDLPLKPSKGLDSIIEGIFGLNLSQIMEVLPKGVKMALEKRKVLFMEMEIDEINEYNVGYLLQMFMIQMMYLGALYGVNPFDQPDVERYKIFLKDLLKEAKSKI